MNEYPLYLCIDKMAQLFSLILLLRRHRRRRRTNVFENRKQRLHVHPYKY